MPQYIITPWRFDRELIQVRRELYQLGDCAPPNDRRRHAVDWVAAWETRGNLPHAVASTAYLVDAILNDEAGTSSQFTIRATYLTAFARFVTGFCDLQQTALSKQSMHLVAKEIGMPASFVELRHDATHNELPSTRRLAHNCEAALNWLWQFYWVKLDDRESELEKPEAKPGELTPAENLEPVVTIVELRSLLVWFLKGRREEIKSKSTDFAPDSASGKTAESLVLLCKNGHANLGILTTILLEEKMLFPAGRVLGDSMDGAFTIWGNLLRRLTLHQRRFLGIFMVRLMSMLTQPASLALQLDPRREAVVKWTLHILTGKEWKDPQIVGKVDKLWAMVMHECTTAPNFWTAIVARTVLEEGDEAFQALWEPYVAVMSD